MRRKMWSSRVSPRSKDNGVVARPSRQLSGRCSARLGAGTRSQESGRMLLEGRVVEVCRSEAAQQYNHHLLAAPAGNSQDGRALIRPCMGAVVLLWFRLIHSMLRISPGKGAATGEGCSSSR